MIANTGQCLCGDVRWELSAEPYKACHCYCKMCRKAHGSEFATYWFVTLEQFRWTSDTDSIVAFRSSHMLNRHFCRRCGSVVPYAGVGADGADDYYVVVAGPHDHGPQATHNIFASHMASWTTITNGLPTFDDYPPELGYGRIGDRPQTAGRDGTVRASCLCGAITADIEQPFRVAHNCHCSRCRRGRAAAHATNGFVPISAVTFTQGEEHLKEFKVPGAKYFTQAYCDVCGSKMPRRDPLRDVAVIPLGCLDDDPGITPVDHIFVADAADWYEITDALPQYDGIPPRR